MANIKSLNKVREAQHKHVTKQLNAKQGRWTVALRHVNDMVKRGAFDSRMQELYISLKCDFSDMKHYMAHPNAAYGSLTAGRLAHRIGKTQATIEAYNKHLVTVASVKADRQAETVRKYFLVIEGKSHYGIWTSSRRRGTGERYGPPNHQTRLTTAEAEYAATTSIVIKAHRNNLGKLRYRDTDTVRN